MRPHFWLPEKTSYGDSLRCDNCKYYQTKNENHKNGICGKSGWICGSWQEAENVQISLFDH